MWDLHLVSHLLIHCQLLQIYLISINTHTHTHYTLCAHTHHDHSLDVSAVLLSRCSDPEIHVEVLDTAVKLRTDLRAPDVVSNSVRTPLFELVCQPISRRAFDTTLVLLRVAKSPLFTNLSDCNIISNYFILQHTHFKISDWNLAT